MKNCLKYLFVLVFLTTSSTIFSQSTQASTTINSDTFTNYSDLFVSNTDTIPGYASALNKIKVTGTIYKSDGVTPASNVILYIEQADENGDFDLRGDNDNRYVYNRGRVKTDANGNYTFYTYVPGNDRRYNLKKQLFPVIKEPSQKEYKIATFFFDDDPLLSKLCRKRLAKKGDPTRILKPKKVGNEFVVIKDIILPNHDAPIGK